MNKQIIITQQRIDELNQQFGIIKNETSIVALSRLNHTKTMQNLKLWIDSLKRNCGSRVRLSEKLVDKLDYWRKYVEGLDELEIEIILDTQIIPDFKLYCNQNEI